MLAYALDPCQTNTPARARMEQRTTPEAKSLIERGARALGLNPSEFTVAAACRAARDTLRSYEVTVLRPADHDAFLQALDATEPTPALVDLMRLHAQVEHVKAEGLHAA